jgi:hypothetical protein
MSLRDQVRQQLFSAPGAEFNIRNSPFFKILQANPSLARFYPEFAGVLKVNSPPLKNLEIKSGSKKKFTAISRQFAANERCKRNEHSQLYSLQG